ncbi:hypothetical protein IE077_003398, partial [Cardiosporidium cionae]
MYEAAESLLREAAAHAASPMDALQILHNLFLVRYHRSGCYSSEKLLSEWSILATAFPLSLPSLSSAATLASLSTSSPLQHQLATLCMKNISAQKTSKSLKEASSTSSSLRNTRKDINVEILPPLSTLLENTSSVDPPTSTSLEATMASFLSVDGNIKSLKPCLSHCFNEALSKEEGLPNRHLEDVALLVYNLSLLYFQKRQYETAVHILEDIFYSIEQFDTFLFVKICILLMELYMKLQQPELAYSVLSYLKKRKDSLFTTEISTKHKNKFFSSCLMGSYLPMETLSSEFLSLEELQYIISIFTTRLALSIKQFKIAKREIKLLQKPFSFQNKMNDIETSPIEELTAAEEREIPTLKREISSYFSSKTNIYYFQLVLQRYYATTALLLQAN